MINTRLRSHTNNTRKRRVESTLRGVESTLTRVWDTLYQPKPIMPNMDRQAPGRSREPTAPMTPSMRDADAVATQTEALIREGDLEKACAILDPLAFGHTKFPILDRVGMRLGQTGLGNATLLEALDRMISRGSVGYYVIVGSALARRLGSNMATCLEKTAEYIVIGENWAKCDSIAERVWGEALVCDFPRAYKYLARMGDHDNRWIRRAVGVAVHYFAKRRPTAMAELRKLLVLLAPMLSEREYDAIKGIGWGFKTIGKYQPRLLTRFLENHVKRAHPTKLMLKKATTYLPAHTKQRLIGLRAKNS